MRSSSYLDTSYLLKAYALEPHSEEVSAFIRALGPDLLVSALTDLEMASSLTRKLSPEDAKPALEDYRQDRRIGLFRVVALSDEVYTLAETIALDLGSRFRLRSLDTLHLAIARFHSAESLATYDDRLASAAHYLGLAVIGARP